MTATSALSGSTLDALEATLHGRLLRPSDDDYDAVRAVFNGMIDRRPAAVIRCADPVDVARGVGFGQEHDLVLAVRGGGHNVAGNAVCDGGLLLDLSGMKGLEVDPRRRSARAGAGLTLGELDRGTQRHGLATPLGVMSGTGITGLTLGGGLGWLNGRYGLACDNLLAAEVVTADGELLRPSPEEHPDLFWAIRGGGGNFGVVTSFTYRLHPVGPVLAGGLSYRWADAGSVLRAHEECVTSAADDLSTAVSLGIDGNGEPALSVAVCWCGTLREGDRALTPVRAMGPAQADTVDVTPYVAWQSAPDPYFPTGRLHYWKAGLLPRVTDAVVDVLLEYVPRMPSPMSGIGLQRLHGATSRVAPDATAFPHRADQYDLQILSQWTDPGDSDRNISWTRDLFEAMRPHLRSDYSGPGLRVMSG